MVKGEVQEYINKTIRIILFIIGTISLGIGIIGIFLPLLPTTPFLLLSAACYARSSKKFYKWLLNNRIFGKYIRNYKENHSVPLKIKLYSIFLLWIAILSSVIFIVENLLFKIILIVIATVVTFHIISIKTIKK